jgi:hypothetical protein
MATKAPESAVVPSAESEGLSAPLTEIQVGPSSLAVRIDYFQSQLEREIHPRSVLESICVSELARHAAGMELGSASEAATLRFAAKTGVTMGLCPASDSADSSFVAAMTSDLVSRASCYTARHARAFHATLDQLQQLSHKPPMLLDVNIFKNEDDCTRYLFDWQQQQAWSCSSCGSSERSWLRSRARFECSCGRQYSPRVGTMFAGSHVPLLAWFQVVVSLVIDPQVRLNDLAARTAVVRRATLREIARRVRDSLASPNVDQQLAGLPQHVFSHLRQVYKSPAELHERVQT